MNIETLNKIGDVSNGMSTLTISIFGGSLAAILSTSYITPVHKVYRSMYFLFVAAWYFLTMSYYYGTLVLRHIILGYSIFDPKVSLSPEGQKFADTFEKNLANDFQAQSDQLKYAVFVLGAWLLLYLVWFIFKKQPVKETI